MSSFSLNLQNNQLKVWHCSRINRILITFIDNAGAEFDCELRASNYRSEWHLVGVRICGEKRMLYKGEECLFDYEASDYEAHEHCLTSISEDEDTMKHAAAKTNSPLEGFPIYHKLLVSMITGVPKDIKKFTVASVSGSLLSKEGNIARMILCLMRHVNAPLFNQSCCAFHSTAIHILFALGPLLSKACKPLWKPIETKDECVSCGLMVLKNTTCLWCTPCATASTGNDSVSDRSFKAESENNTVSRDQFTNYCVNALRHVGQADLSTAIEYLLGAAVDLSVHPKWNVFWETHRPCNFWRCAACRAKNDENDRRCYICGIPNQLI